MLIFIVSDLTNDDDGLRFGEEGFHCADFPDSTMDTVTFCNVARYKGGRIQGVRPYDNGYILIFIFMGLDKQNF